jgi:hypothetical protein
MIRLTPVTDSFRAFCERKGIEVAPDTVPAEDVGKYPETRTARGSGD